MNTILTALTAIAALTLFYSNGLKRSAFLLCVIGLLTSVTFALNGSFILSAACTIVAILTAAAFLYINTNGNETVIRRIVSPFPSILFFSGVGALLLLSYFVLTDFPLYPTSFAEHRHIKSYGFYYFDLVILALAFFPTAIIVKLLDGHRQ